MSHHRRNRHRPCVAEADAEGIHRDVSHGSRHATAAKFTWLASSCLLNDNVQMCDAYLQSERTQGLFNHDWATYQKIAQRRVKFSARPSRMSKKKLRKYVYHAGGGLLDSVVSEGVMPFLEEEWGWGSKVYVCCASFAAPHNKFSCFLNGRLQT